MRGQTPKIEGRTPDTGSLLLGSHSAVMNVRRAVLPSPHGLPSEYSIKTPREWSDDAVWSVSVSLHQHGARIHPVRHVRKSRILIESRTPSES
jgi:hypothetical protein